MMNKDQGLITKQTIGIVLAIMFGGGAVNSKNIYDYLQAEESISNQEILLIKVDDNKQLIIDNAKLNKKHKELLQKLVSSWRDCK